MGTLHYYLMNLESTIRNNHIVNKETKNCHPQGNIFRHIQKIGDHMSIFLSATLLSVIHENEFGSWNSARKLVYFVSIKNTYIYLMRLHGTTN